MFRPPHERGVGCCQSIKWPCPHRLDLHEVYQNFKPHIQTLKTIQQGTPNPVSPEPKLNHHNSNLNLKTSASLLPPIYYPIMAPTWSRSLFYPSPPSDSRAMWDRPSNLAPIFAAARPSPSEMWSRPAAGLPIFADSVPSPSPMWHRPGAAAAPMCPCCAIASYDEQQQQAVGMRRVGRRPGSGDSAATSAGGNSLGLRLKRSFRSLRSKASVASLRG